MSVFGVPGNLLVLEEEPGYCRSPGLRPAEPKLHLVIGKDVLLVKRFLSGFVGALWNPQRQDFSLL